MVCHGQQIAVDFEVKQRLDFQDLVKNGKFIIDQDGLEYEDFMQGGGPMVVRKKKRARGRPISELYHQIPVQDVTAGNWNDVSMLIQLAKEGNGITEAASQLPERPTAVGIQAIEGRSIGRMARIALNIDEQSRMDMAYQGLCNVAQWMSTEVILDIAGQQEALIRESYGLPPEATGLLVGSWDVDPDLDVVPLHAMSQGPKNVPAMTEFVKTLVGAPGVMDQFVARFPFERFFTDYLREMGITDIDWYQASMTPTANDQVLQQVQAGNLVPMSAAIQGATV